MFHEFWSRAMQGHTGMKGQILYLFRGCSHGVVLCVVSLNLVRWRLSLPASYRKPSLTWISAELPSSSQAVNLCQGQIGYVIRLCFVHEDSHYKGLFACSKIPAGIIVVQYLGEYFESTDWSESACGSHCWVFCDSNESVRVLDAQDYRSVRHTSILSSV
jgi:hypothetical protein